MPAEEGTFQAVIMQEKTKTNRTRGQKMGRKDRRVPDLAESKSDLEEKKMK